MRQTDELIRDVVECVEGPTESEILMALLRLRDNIAGRMELGDDCGTLVSDSCLEVVRLFDKFFQERLLLAIPQAHQLSNRVADGD